MSSRYRRYAEEGERRLSALLARAGVAGAEWVWEDIGRGSNTERRLVLAPASILLADKTAADSVASLKAFFRAPAAACTGQPPASALAADARSVPAAPASAR